MLVESFIYISLSAFVYALKFDVEQAAIVFYYLNDFGPVGVGLVQRSDGYFMVEELYSSK